MNQRIIQNILVAVWLALSAYDTVIGIPEYMLLAVFMSWLFSVAVAIKWASEIRITKFSKYAGLPVLAFAIFISFGMAIDFLTEISPELDEQYQRVVLVILQLILASIFSAVIVFAPLVVFYRKNFIFVVFMVCAPVIIFHAHSITTRVKFTTQLILSFEIVSMVLIICGSCVLARKYLEAVS